MNTTITLRIAPRQPAVGTLRVLMGIGALLILIYGVATVYGPFRPGRMEGFFILFGCAFFLYALACWLVVRHPPTDRRSLAAIIGLATIFNLALVPSLPTLSDDMYRYVWDGRIQGNGINPYRYPSNAAATATLRDDQIWARMNRGGAVTVYPPGAQMVFAAIWRAVPDSITAFKLIFILCVFVAGGLLIPLLNAWGLSSARVLIFLWNPLLIFEVAHAAHVDALYLPLIVGAILLRQTAPTNRLSPRHEAGIGLLIGLATLIKLYPILLLPALWSVRRGRFKGRLLLPLVAVVTVAFGYALYIAPEVDTLGFLPNYVREFFNIGPLPQVLVNWAISSRVAYYLPTQVLMPVAVVIASAYFTLRPAQTAQQAIQRCAVPIAITLLININLFSWYTLWLLPFVALSLEFSILSSAFGWWLFSGSVALSYHIFLTQYAIEWVAWVEFVPLYVVLVCSSLAKFRPCISGLRNKEAVV